MINCIIFTCSSIVAVTASIFFLVSVNANKFAAAAITTVLFRLCWKCHIKTRRKQVTWTRRTCLVNSWKKHSMILRTKNHGGVSTPVMGPTIVVTVYMILLRQLHNEMKEFPTLCSCIYSPDWEYRNPPGLSRWMLSCYHLYHAAKKEKRKKDNSCKFLPS